MHTQYGGVRPYGVSLLVAGIDDHGPQLFTTDPSGSFWGWKAAAIGKEADVVRDFFAEKYKASITLDGALDLAIEGLLKSTDKAEVEPAEKAKTLEIGKIDTKDKMFTILSQDEVEEVLKARLTA
jgi:proteasome alpha subunit